VKKDILEPKTQNDWMTQWTEMNGKTWWNHAKGLNGLYGLKKKTKILLVN